MRLHSVIDSFDWNIYNSKDHDTLYQCRENRIVRTPYRSAFNSENGLSEEDNEENTSEHSVRNTPDQLLSSLSAENLQMELSKCSSDGLSDKENVVRNLKNQVKHPVDSLTLPVSGVSDVDQIWAFAGGDIPILFTITSVGNKSQPGADTS